MAANKHQAYVKPFALLRDDEKGLVIGQDAKPQYRISRIHDISEDEHAALDNDDLETDFIIKQIQKQYYCSISTAPQHGPNAIEILGHTEDDVESAIAALERVLRTKNDEGGTWVTSVLTHPLNQGNEDVQITMKLQEGALGARPIIANPLDSKLSPGIAQEMAYRTELAKTIEEPFGNLSKIPQKMRMRVRFGSLRLQQWTRGKTMYTYPELQLLARRAGRRGTAQMDTFVGNLEKLDTLHDKLSNVNSLVSLAAGAGTFKVKPVHSIVLITKNLVVESVLESSHAKASVGQDRNAAVDHFFGPFQVQRTEKHRRTMHIMTACPQIRYDWMLEVVGLLDEKEVQTHVPFSRAKMKKAISFTGETVAGDFPVFKVMSHFREDHGISSALGKATWTYALTPFYSAEVSVYHRMEEDESHNACGVGVALFSQEWDWKMDYANLLRKPRSWSNFVDGFLVDTLTVRQAEDGEKNPWDEFFRWIRHIQDALGTDQTTLKTDHALGQTQF